MRQLCAALLLIAACCFGCDSAEPEPKTRFPTPVAPRATLSIEPTTLRIGDVATLDLVVVTPPGERVLPLQPPKIAGVWWLDSESAPIERRADRWIHRTRLRMRARELGPFAWPDGEVTLESETGDRRPLKLSGRRFEVVSILPAVPDRVTPFGLREAAEEKVDEGYGFWGPAATGAATALAAMALLFGVRGWWWRRGSESEIRAAPLDLDLWQWTQRELDRARTQVDESPIEAASAGAHLLRQYVGRRFGADTEAATTPELAAARPPRGVRSRWPTFVRILQRLDDARFRPTDDARAGDTSVAALLDEIQNFVRDSAPRDGRT